MDLRERCENFDRVCGGTLPEYFSDRKNEDESPSMVEDINPSIQITGRRRDKCNSLEQYFTDEDVMAECVRHTKLNLPDIQFDQIIDPCAGNVPEYKAVRKYFPNVPVVYSDIDPKKRFVEKRDFIKNPHFTSRPDRSILTICNPPFGGGNKLVRRFMSNALRFSKAAAFIIPTAFMNHHNCYTKNIVRGDQHWRIIHEIRLRPDIFTVNGDSFSWACVFQIWLRMDTPRAPLSPTPVSNQFQRIGRRDPEDPTINMFLCNDGSNAGQMFERGVKDGKRKVQRSQHTHWRLKPRSIYFKSRKHRDLLRKMINANCAQFMITGHQKCHINVHDAVPRLDALTEHVIAMIEDDDVGDVAE